MNRAGPRDDPPHGVRFGTDGLRGPANVEVTPEVCLALGRAVGRVLADGRVLLGRDPRWSGPMVQAALAAGITAEGSDAVDCGVLPTPALAWLAARENAPAAMISASHNPFGDNGVKVFAAGGRKLSDAEQARVETGLDRVAGDLRPGGPTGDGLGRLLPHPAPLDGYRRHLLDAAGGRRLDGIRIVLDAAHGAASSLAGGVFTDAGAEVARVLAAEPDGRNINAGVGSTDLRGLRAAVVETGSHLGLALDGDADRVLAVDERGCDVDGDHLLALLAVDLRDRGRLRGDVVVVTVMSNLGFHRAMADAGIEVVTTPVGDRHVLAALAARDASLGGEQSGHVILADLATTGDGLLAGLALADLVARRGEPLGVLARAAMTTVPQVLRNVVVDRRPDDLAAVAAEVAAAETELADDGRVLLRTSGTEPLVRVMVEAGDVDTAERVTDRLVAAVRRAYG